MNRPFMAQVSVRLRPPGLSAIAGCLLNGRAGAKTAPVSKDLETMYDNPLTNAGCLTRSEGDYHRDTEITEAVSLCPLWLDGFFRPSPPPVIPRPHEHL